MKNTAVIGIGNILLKDDGIGVHTIRELEKEDLPSTVELVDGGTSTLAMLSYFLEYRKIIVIDALRAGLEPGTIYRIRPEELAGYEKGNLSIHDVQILDVVRMARMLGAAPDVIIFGIEPQEIGYELEMSALMRSKIPDIIELLKQELGFASQEETNFA
ncbi:HyaD/HybD family hydrogenase maturation endopeptidase [Paenibacillus durus]|uniref:Hydrogenase maturation protease n=1 Tax=Paenibacillus durus ATCC 35681 TaxID=1333534 RepID=A0A0F7FBD5_PAEDU|nr:HyaD/HybD family hydrogenase maturation endopeptidase [Paenibacillus durus]AKG35619.1 hydrogenase maturation protease [Paenibacillus durus ATCC 35681]